MNAKAAIPLVLAVVLGLVAAVLVRNAIANKKTAAVAPTNLVSVVVAKQDVEPGHELTKDDVTVSKIPAEAAPGQIFSDPAQLVGRVPTAQLVKGQTVLETLLAPAGNGGGLQALVPQGMRAVTLEATEYSAVGGMLRPGCRIDVMSVLRNEKSNLQISRIVLQNILVSAIGHNVTPNPPPADANGSAPAPSNVNAITLILTPKQAQMLQMAMISGRPWFALRSGRDQKQVDVEGTTMAELRGEDPTQANDAVASATPSQNQTIQTQAVLPVSSNQDAQPATIKRTVQVIRGGAESQVTFILPAPRGLSVENDLNDAGVPNLAPAGIH